MQLQPESRFLLHWSVVLIALSAFVIICAKSNDDLAQSNGEATINNDSTDATEEIDFGSRSALGGRYMDKLPDWLFPIICLKQLNKLDGYHCGMGIRLEQDIFLASAHSIDAAKKGDRFIDKPPGIFDEHPRAYFGFDMQTNWSIANAAPFEKHWHWKPDFKLTYKYGISMYKVIHRGIGVPEPIPVLPQKPLLDDQEPSNETLCRVYTFGDRENGDEGVYKPWRKPVALYVQEMGCGEGDDDALCRFGPAVKRENRNDTGFLCSRSADVGAPVVCGLGRLARIRYIITAMRFNDTIECKRRFIALKLKRFTKQILEDVDQYTEETNI